MTALIESPMKLFVYNQNRSGVIFGSDNEDTVKNVVKFEIKLKYRNLFNVLPVQNKPTRAEEWRITDFNGVMNENPYFK